MNKQEKLNILNEKVKVCDKCEELTLYRKNTVFGEGNPNGIVFMGEAPGKNEDEKGRPFVGRAGELLDNILKACGLEREKVYILNVLKCRPPSNRVPAPEEAANCRPFLDLQLKIINPKYIVCMGASAANYLLNIKMPIGNMRNQWFEYGGAKVLCTFHPAYLLRNPDAKKDMWEDLQLLLAELAK